MKTRNQDAYFKILAQLNVYNFVTKKYIVLSRQRYEEYAVFERMLLKAFKDNRFGKLEQNQYFLDTQSPDNVQYKHYKHIETDGLYETDAYLMDVPYNSREEKMLVKYALCHKKKK